MIPHVSLTEMFQAGLVIFGAGVFAGLWLAYKLDGMFQRRKKTP